MCICFYCYEKSHSRAVGRESCACALPSSRVRAFFGYEVEEEKKVKLNGKLHFHSTSNTISPTRMQFGVRARKQYCSTGRKGKALNWRAQTEWNVLLVKVKWTVIDRDKRRSMYTAHTLTTHWLVIIVIIVRPCRLLGWFVVSLTLSVSLWRARYSAVWKHTSLWRTREYAMLTLSPNPHAHTHTQSISMSSLLLSTERHEMVVWYSYYDD